MRAEHYLKVRGHDAFFKRWMLSDRSGVELPDSESPNANDLQLRKE